MALNNRAPSVSRLKRELNVSKETAAEIRRIWEEARIDDVLDKYPLTRDWYISCYHKPKNRHIRREAISELLRAEGYCGLGLFGRNSNGILVEGLNAGDLYTASLFFSACFMYISTAGCEINRLQPISNDDL